LVSPAPSHGAIYTQHGAVVWSGGLVGKYRSEVEGPATRAGPFCRVTQQGDARQSSVGDRVVLSKPHEVLRKSTLLLCNAGQDLRTI